MGRPTSELISDLSGFCSAQDFEPAEFVRKKKHKSKRYYTGGVYH